jgi:hypothetical protein
MKYFNINDLRFGLTLALSFAALVVLLASVKCRGKGWLVGFLILSQMTYAGYYIPSLMFRLETLSSDTYRKIMELLNIVFSVLGMASWALLLAFVLSLKSSAQTAATPDGEGTTNMEVPAPLPDSPYKGYDGWLAFFGIVQLFIQPVLTVIMLIFLVADFSEGSARYPSLVILYSVEAAGSIALVLLGMHSALQLRHVRRGAVRGVKRYLLIALIWSAIAAVLPFMGEIPDRSREGMIIGSAQGFLRTLIFFAIWFTYFNISRRVRATYVD